MSNIITLCGFCAGSHESSPHTLTYVFKIHFSILLSRTVPQLFQSPRGFTTKNCRPMHFSYPAHLILKSIALTISGEEYEPGHNPKFSILLLHHPSCIRMLSSASTSQKYSFIMARGDVNKHIKQQVKLIKTKLLKTVIRH
jgi:hypothetical protein